MSKKVYGLVIGVHGTQTKLIASETDLSTFSFFQRFSIGEAINFFAKTIVERTPPGTRSKIEESAYIGYVFVREDNLSGVFICEEGYPMRSAFALLENVLKEFTEIFPKKEDWPNMTPEITRKKYNKLKEYLELGKDPGKVDPLFNIQKELDDTRVIVHKTLNSLIERGEKLDDLVEKSEELSMSSKAFYSAAKKTNSCC